MTARATRLHRFLLLFVGSVLLVSVPAAAFPTAPPYPTVPRTIVDFLRGEIQSSDPARREHAIMDVIALVNCRTYCTVRLLSAAKTVHVQNDERVGSMLDLSGLAPDLLWTYRTGPSDELRLLAMAALLHLRNEPTLDTLLHLSEHMSARVRRATHRGIAAVFIEQYPALLEQVRRTHTLSLTDIRRARSQRERAQKNTPRSSQPRD